MFLDIPSVVKPLINRDEQKCTCIPDTQKGKNIKPYITYADSHPEALGGFASTRPDVIPVDFPAALLEKLPAEKRAAAVGVLAHDPRPRYQDDDREYGMSFAGFNIRFHVADGVLTVTAVEREES